MNARRAGVTVTLVVEKLVGVASVPSAEAPLESNLTVDGANAGESAGDRPSDEPPVTNVSSDDDRTATEEPQMEAGKMEPGDLA